MLCLGLLRLELKAGHLHELWNSESALALAQQTLPTGLPAQPGPPPSKSFPLLRFFSSINFGGCSQNNWLNLFIISCFIIGNYSLYFTGWHIFFSCYTLSVLLASQCVWILFEWCFLQYHLFYVLEFLFLGNFTEKLKWTNLQGRDIETPRCFVGKSKWR